MLNGTTYVTLEVLAGNLGLPAAWLQRETLSGALPSILTGRGRRFDEASVREALRERARLEAMRGTDLLHVLRLAERNDPMSPAAFTLRAEVARRYADGRLVDTMTHSGIAAGLEKQTTSSPGSRRAKP